ncbi:hypothetical protein JNO63_05765 [Anaerococcus sp. mt242]|uniref:hypothetical protein n=1 Tax=Anaerococcus sp. mt242 TaxID=2661917 RepID=UPI0019313C46|nr:hypothetical protein [Anaerococcus sp. mt242]MBM0046596.1 hypothetical protein [Anaerococcus sp. mt242]
MKRKHYNLVSIDLWIVALVLIFAFNNPFATNITWNIVLAIILTVVGFILYFAANMCPYCNGLINDYLLKPAKYCPHCGKDISKF